MREERPRESSRLGCVLLFVLAVAGVGCLGQQWPIELAGQLAIGWVPFLGRVLPQLEVSPGALLSGALFCAGFVLGLHLLARHLSGAKRWSFRRSLAISLLVLLSFATGVAVVGIVHQTIWMLQGRLVAKRNIPPEVFYESVSQTAYGILNAEAPAPLPELVRTTQARALLPEKLHWVIFPDTTGCVGALVLFPRDPEERARTGGWLVRRGDPPSRDDYQRLRGTAIETTIAALR